jgi:geranylgeranyl diphosphate synthase type 3
MLEARADAPDVLQKRTNSVSVKSHTVEYLRTQTRSFEYTLGVLTTLRRQTMDEIERLGGNKGLEAIMERLSVPVPRG